MTLTPPSAERVWPLILEAGRLEWCEAGAVMLGDGRLELEIRPDGQWRCWPEPTPAAADLLDIFLPLVAGPGPRVVGQLGQSLDGRIATESGASFYINGEAARTHLHRLRALVDAVVIGVSTLNADDPQLTVRHTSGSHPVRVVVDPRDRARQDARMFHDAEASTLHLVGAEHLHARGERSGRAERLAIDTRGGCVDPACILELLAGRGLRRVLVEGGGITVSRFLQAGALDRLHLLVAPLVIGSGRAGLSLPVIQTLDCALRPRSRRFGIAEDTLFDLQLR